MTAKNGAVLDVRVLPGAAKVVVYKDDRLFPMLAVVDDVVAAVLGIWDSTEIGNRS